MFEKHDFFDMTKLLSLPNSLKSPNLVPIVPKLGLFGG